MRTDGTEIALKKFSVMVKICYKESMLRGTHVVENLFHNEAIYGSGNLSHRESLLLNQPLIM